MVATYIAVFLAALALSLALTPVVRPLAMKLGAVDLPGERKIHKTPVPRLGGAAVLLAVSVATAGALALNSGLHPAIAGGLGAARWSALAVAVLLVVTLGGIDDLWGLSPRVKFVAEILAAAVVVFVAGAPRSIDLSPFAGPLHLGVAGPVLGILWIVAITNAVNMSDGVDGVAAGVSAIAAVPLALASFTLGNPIAAAILIALSGALIGFLPHNFRRPKTFLGDSGSLGVGFVLGSASLVGLEQAGAWLAVPALLILALPVAEVGLTVLRRSLRALTVVRSEVPQERFLLSLGEAGLFTADQRHVPHRLLELGLHPRSALAVLYVAAATLGTLGFFTLRWPLMGPFAALLVIAGLVYLTPRWLYDELRVLERGALLPILDTSLIRNRPLHALFDAAVIVLAFIAAQVVVSGWGGLPVSAQGWLSVAAATGAALFGFWLGGLYRISCRHAGIAESLRAARSVLLGMLLAAGAFLLLSGQPIPLAVWIIQSFLVLTVAVGGRFSFRILDHVYQLGSNSGRRALIFGAGRAGAAALKEMLSNRSLGWTPVGFFDDDPGKRDREFHGLKVFGGSELESVIAELEIDDLVVAAQNLPASRRQDLVDVSHLCGVRLIDFALQWNETDGRPSVSRLPQLDPVLKIPPQSPRSRDAAAR